METTSTKTLELDFLTKNGDSMTMSLPDYLDDLTQEQIEASAQTIVDQNIFQPSGDVYKRQGVSDIATWEYTLDGGQTWTDPRAWGDENILEIKEDGVYLSLIHISALSIRCTRQQIPMQQRMKQILWKPSVSAARIR